MKPRSIVILLAGLAFLAKLYCAATTYGSSDVLTFWSFGRYIHQYGLIAMYRATPAFNHTPLIGCFVAGAHTLALQQHDPFLFNLYLRLPVIFADLLAVFALLWLREKTGRPSWWTLGLFAVSPVSFMVSGFHGNVDSMMVLGLLLAAVACVAERPALSGLFLGLSCNIKIIPLLLLPALFFFWFNRGRALRFSVSAAVTILAGWSVPLVTIPAIFCKDVLGYSSIWGTWGIPYALRLTDLAAFRGILFSDKTPTEIAVTSVLKLIIVSGVLFWAWNRRRLEPLEVFKTIALSFAIFFVLAPGFGAQYLIWPAPFFILASESWYLALTVTSSAGLFVFYNAACGDRIPWDKAFHPLRTAPEWAPWLVLPWLVLAGYLVCSARLRLTVPSVSSESVTALATAREA